MDIDRRLIAGTLGLALGLAACGGTATTSPAASGAVGGASATPDVTATGSPAESPSGSPDASGSSASPATGASPSADAGAASPGAGGDLEAMLPSEAAGITFTKRSIDGATASESAFNVMLGELDTILQANGKSMEDVRMAVAAPTDVTGGDTATVVAIQVDGVPADQLVATTGVSGTALESTSIGGKQVLAGGTDAMMVVVYPKDDIVFKISLASRDVAEAILAQLP